MNYGGTVAATGLPGGFLAKIFKVVFSEEVLQFAEHLLAGRVNGQVVVDVTL